MPKKIKIIDSQDPHFWYTEFVDSEATFPVIREEADCYWTREPAGYLNFDLKKDAKEV